MSFHASSSIRMLLLVALFIAALDQLTKTWIASSLDLYETVPVIPGFFSLTHITNTGAAFGFMAGKDAWRHTFFQVVSVVALGVLIYLFRSSSARTLSFFWGCALILGGASGNLIDRLRHRSVTDFLDFYVDTLHWPAFNVADSAITLGGVLLAWHFFRSSP
jgi:signal peptidase II